ncbi:hypothetical protein ACN469_26775 [Corallococcus terminator]
MAVNSTLFNVTNNTHGQLGNQHILVFLTPVLSSTNCVYAAWQKLNPGEGATQPFTLNQNISATVTTSNGTMSAPVTISPSYLSQVTNPDGLSPVLGTPQLSQNVTPQQAGVQNTTSTAFEEVNVNWSVNGNLVVSTKTPLTASAFSTFELRTSLYWCVGSSEQEKAYTLGEITPLQSYALEAGTSIVNVSVTYDKATGKYGYAFTS